MSDPSRREILVAGAAAVAAAAVSSIGFSAGAQQPATELPAAFTLPPLAYPHDAMEPYIDAMTMHIHHEKHHGAFVTNLNKLATAHAVLAATPMEKLLADQCALVPEAVRTPVRNNLGGHHNHSLFWEILSPADSPRADGKPVPVGKLADAITGTFGSYDKLKEQLVAGGMARFGSGWSWLVLKDGKLSVTSTANQDSPLMDGAYPVMGIDVWEHAYYLKYQNRRAEYLAAIFNLINWRVCDERYTARL
jgi:Fe-Mn family superoxide dismutase